MDANVEDGQPKKTTVVFQFSEATIRAAFIRKVFGMVTVMLAIVAVMTAIPFMSDKIKDYVQDSIAMYISAYAVFLILYIVLICCPSVRRAFPINIILTAIFTLATGYMVAVIAAFHDVVSVLLALIITTVCCGSIILFSMQTKHDLTKKLGLAFILSIALLMFGLVGGITSAFFAVPFLYSVYAGLAALLFMFYLAIDIQLIMGGRTNQISPEDYIFAAIQLFLDIINIFLMILGLFKR